MKQPKKLTKAQRSKQEEQVHQAITRVASSLCIDCGNIGFHSQRCELEDSAAESGVTAEEYYKTPHLWCYSLSGFGGEEKARCVRPLGHEGGHGFPVSAAVLKYQRDSGAIEAALEVEALAAQAAPVLPTPEPRVKRVRAPRAPGGGVAVDPAFAAKVVHVLVTENPRREGSELHRLFQMVMAGGVTVGAWLAAGAEASSVMKCVARGWVELREIH